MQDRFERFGIYHRIAPLSAKIKRTGNGTDGLKSRLYHVSVLSGKAPGRADRHAADVAV